MALALSLTGLEARVIQLETAQSALPTRQNVAEKLGTFSDDLLVLDDTDLTQSDSIDRLREALRALNVSVFNHIPLFVDHTGDNPFGHHIIAEEDPAFVSFVDWDGHTGDASAHHPQVAQTGLVTTALFEAHSGKSYNDAHHTQVYGGGWTDQNWTCNLSFFAVATQQRVAVSPTGDLLWSKVGQRTTIRYPGVYVIDGNLGFELLNVRTPSGQGVVSVAINDVTMSGCNGTTAWTMRAPGSSIPGCNASARQIMRLYSGDVIAPVQRRLNAIGGFRVSRKGTNFVLWRIAD